MAKIKGKWQDSIRSPYYYNNMSREELSPIISQLSAVANKRLKRLEKAGKTYGSTDGADTISGVRKFGAKGKTVGELRAEYKRLKGFLESKTSTLSGRKERYYQAVKRRWEQTKKESDEQEQKQKQEPKRQDVYKEYLEGGSEVDFFDAVSNIFKQAREEGWLGKSGALQKMQESDDIRDLYEEKVMQAQENGKMTLDEIVNYVRADLGIESPFEDEDIDESTSTSDFF